MKFFILLLASFTSLLTFAQDGKKVQFVGGARSLISHSDFTSDAEDTVTARKNTGGYALIDLGIKINPNANTEILGMLRIKNAFGGFWGSGVTFDVRQLYVKGVAGNVLRYQIGNIDYKLSPYTFYNHNPDLLVQTSGTNKIKEEVLNYESFYSNKNTWRQQGAAADFAIQFPKFVQEIKFNGFITRLNPSNLSNILERLYGGGNITLTQSKYFSIAYNHVSVFDLKQTANNNDAYRNNVNTLTYELKFDQEKYKVSVDGESGFSSSFSTQNNEGKLSDYFVNAKVNLELKKAGLKLHVGYMDNGADFRSFGAQSKRIDFNQTNNFYERYTNEQIVRPLSNYDLYNDPTLYNASISTKIMAYNPMINNVLPYGTATFNRRGLYAGAHFSDKKKIILADLSYYRLSEVRGQGTFELRKFNYLNSNVRFNFSNLMKWKKQQVLQLGIAYQTTKRTSEFDFEKIDLKTLTLHTGLELEVIKDLTLLGNVYYFNTNGNEIMPIRNTVGDIINFYGVVAGGDEYNLSGGLKFNFSKDIYLAAIFESNRNSLNDQLAYRYKQVMLYYIMKF